MLVVLSTGPRSIASDTNNVTNYLEHLERLNENLQRRAREPEDEAQYRSSCSG